MKTVDATEAARDFLAVLDAVEHRGQMYVVTRGGRPVARITPVPMANGHWIKQLLREHQLDSGRPAEIDALRADLPVEERARTG